jgi:hypothetical protein
METVTNTNTHRHIICWKSAFAGLAIALITFAGLMALSAAFGGIGLADGTTVKHATFFTAACAVLTTFFAAGAGGYYSARVSRHRVDLAGIAQGALVGSLMLLFVLAQGASALGTLVKTSGTVIGGSIAAAGTAATDPVVQDIVEDASGDLKFKSEPSVVAKGVASRLIRGDTEAAKNYLAYQASITPAQADQKINQAKAKIDAAAVKAREATADALKAGGWTALVLIVAGMMAACMGGYLATHHNSRYYLDTSYEEVIRNRTISRAA